MKCVFYDEQKRNCSILRKCDCVDCKFAKTKEEFDAAKQEASLALFAKGLKKVTRANPDGSCYVTVKRIWGEEEQEWLDNNLVR